MKEFKIIVGDTSTNTHIYVDGEKIGLVQDIKIRVGVDTIPTVEITFPDLRSFSGEAAKRVADQVELLKELPQVKTCLAKVSFKRS